MTKMNEKTTTNNIITRRSLHYFWSATKKYKLLTAGAIITTPVVYFLRVLNPLILANMIEILTSGVSGDELAAKIIPQAILLLLVEFVRSHVIGPIRLYCVWRMELSAMFDLGNDCFDTIAEQSMQFHSNRFSGSLVSQVNKFIGSYERFMDEFFWNIFPVLLDTILIMSIMIPRAPLFAAGILLFMIIYMVVATFWSKRIAPLNEHEASVESKRTGQLADSITNIVSVKSYAKEAHEHRRFEKYQEEVYDASYNILKADTKRNYCIDSIYLLMNGLIILFMLFGQNIFGLSISTLVLIINYSGNIMGDLWSVHSVFKTMNRIFGDAKEMTEILDMEDDVVDEPGAKKLQIEKAEIDFRNITFKHHDAKNKLFDNFSLKVNPGERIGLVGVSGSGKTTLTKLLLRFADVDNGEIDIDGQNIRFITQHSLRGAIAYVPQETSLFHRSIAENIAYSRPEAKMKEIIQAAKLANADEFIRELPNDYDTLVGERGIKLSGGQRQRIAIARAILKDAPILVLDEATSALDSESEALIQSALKRLMKGRTSIVIAHRLSTVANLDRIVVLEKGKIIEQGTHAELLKQGKAYSKLWSRQSGAFLDEE